MSDKSVDIWYYDSDANPRLKVKNFPGHDHSSTEFTTSVASKGTIADQTSKKLLINPNAPVAIEFKDGDE